VPTPDLYFLSVGIRCGVLLVEMFHFGTAITQCALTYVCVCVCVCVTEQRCQLPRLQSINNGSMNQYCILEKLYWQGTTEGFEESMCQCNFDHHKSHTNRRGIRTRPPSYGMGD